nr:tetratricopeptide repeat protein [bacterium]
AYFIEAYSNLAAVIYRQGEVKKAIELYEKIIELRPAVALGYYNLGNLYAQEGDYSQAIRYWQKTLRVDPNFKEAEQRLLQVWQEMEK